MAKIMVVDDEAPLVELLELILDEMGHNVLIAENGQNALKIMEENVPALVITDVMMPVMDGYSLLKQIRSRPEWQGVKVILVSAARLNRQTEYQADEYLAKPYDVLQIEEIVERLLA